LFSLSLFFFSTGTTTELPHEDIVIVLFTRNDQITQKKTRLMKSKLIFQALCTTSQLYRSLCSLSEFVGIFSFVLSVQCTKDVGTVLNLFKFSHIHERDAKMPFRVFNHLPLATVQKTLTVDYNKRNWIS
jgi:hypothetical protein